MKAGKLIEKLIKFDPNTEVIIQSDNFELRGAYVPLSYIQERNQCTEEIQTFTDGFDYEQYTKTVWNIYGGDTKAIIIS